MDWGGIATLISAVGGFLTVIVGLIFQIINFRDQRKARMEQAVHKEKLDAIAATVQQLQTNK